MKIQSKRTFILPFEEHHIEDILKMLLEPDSNRFIKPLHGKNKLELRTRLEANLEKNKKQLQYFSVFDLESRQFVGTMNLNEFNDTGLLQLGLHLKKNYWNQGYGFELCKTMLDFVFNELKLNEIHWVFETDHKVSEKLALKLGFKPFKEMIDEGCPLKIYKLEDRSYSKT